MNGPFVPISFSFHSLLLSPFLVGSAKPFFSRVPLYHLLFFFAYCLPVRSVTPDRFLSLYFLFFLVFLPSGCSFSSEYSRTLTLPVTHPVFFLLNARY